MPPPCATEVTVAQLTLLPLVVPPLLLVVVLEELQAAVSSRLPTTAVLAAITCLVRTIPSQTTVP
jgi:hypothetical protein